MKANGFTLVEMVIVAAIATIIGVLIYDQVEGNDDKEGTYLIRTDDYSWPHVESYTEDEGCVKFTYVRSEIKVCGTYHIIKSN